MEFQQKATTDGRNGLEMVQVAQWVFKDTSLTLLLLRVFKLRLITLYVDKVVFCMLIKLYFVFNHVTLKLKHQAPEPATI